MKKRRMKNLYNLISITYIALLLSIVLSASSCNNDTVEEKTNSNPTSQIELAFPNCQGWGCYTQGGRNGQIIFVTNLNDSGKGSLRDAINTDGPRTILFKVNGIIYLQSPIELGHKIDMSIAEQRSNVSIFGQSAPGGGVVIADYNFNITNVHDIIIQHLRFRNSIRDSTITGALGDGSEVAGSKRVVIDHCSFSWATDEQISSELRNDVPTDSLTIQNCIFAEGLFNGGHEAGHHSRGAHFSRGIDHIGFHHNFFISNNKRNASLVGNYDSEAVGPNHPVFDFRYNVIYNYGEHATKVDRGAYVNIVGNLYDKGPGNPPFIEIENFTVGADTQIYLANNFSVNDPQATQSDLVNWPGIVDEGLQSSPFSTPTVTPTSISNLPTYIHNVGALPHDPTDTRLFNEYDSGMGSLGAPNRTHSDPIPPPIIGVVLADIDNDGIPDDFDPLPNVFSAWEDTNNDGWSDLEAYLSGLEIN